MQIATAIKEKFGKKPSQVSAAQAEVVKTPLSPFVRSFLEGLCAGAVILAFLIGWMAYRAEDTAHKMQEIIPSKAILIQMAEKPAPSPDPSAPQEALKTAKVSLALPPAPIEGLLDNFEGRKLPVVRLQDDLTPFDAYKRPFEAVAGRALVSIVVVDYGLSEKLSQEVLDKMPPDVSLALNTYTQEPAKWAASSRAFGHEFWLTLPMQTKNADQFDSGPHTLMLSAPLADNRARLFDVMSMVAGYAGLVSQKDHAFVKTDLDVSPIVKQILGRGLAFAESNPGIPGFGLSIAMESNFPYIQNTLWLDEDLHPNSIDAALADLELKATKQGRIVAFVHPYPAVLDKISLWIKSTDEKGIQIAPLSAMVQ